MTRQITVLALLLGAALPSTASAQSWGDFSKAFPLFPCQDGWVGCLVEGEPVNPDMVADSSGVPIPSNMRVSWFDLEPTSSFSPFVDLSEYTGELPAVAVAAAAAVEPEPVEAPVPVAPPEPSPEEIAANQVAKQANAEAARMEAESRAAEQAAKAAAAEQEAQRKAGADAEKRKKELEAQAKAAASASEADALRKQAEAEAKKAKEAEEARKKAEIESKKREEERLAKAKAEDDARKKAEEAEVARAAAEAEAAKQAEEAARVAAAEAAKKKAADDALAAADLAKAAEVKVAAVEVPAGSETCEPGELVKLEPQAMLGKLSVGQLKACEGSLGAVTKMTDKEKISRVLMVNAFSKGDKATWEQLVKRHLDEIDQSDPDLCYKYALHLSKQGAGRATGVIRWANVALENRTVWTGDTYTSRVYSLYKLRAAAAQQLWQKAEQDHAATPSDATKKKVDDYRAQTKVLAREWYEYAKVAGKDTTTALQLCMSAAGTADYCEAQ